MHSSLRTDFLPLFSTQNPCCDQNTIAILFVLTIYQHLIWRAIEELEDAEIAYDRIYPAVIPPPGTRARRSCTSSFADSPSAASHS